MLECDSGSLGVLDLVIKVVILPATLDFSLYWTRQSEGPDPIIQLVMSKSNTYMIVPTIFFKLLLWPKKESNCMDQICFENF